MKSQRESVANQIKSQQWIDPEMLSFDLTKRPQGLKVEDWNIVLDSLFCLCVLYNWGFPLDGYHPNELAPYVSKALPSDIASRVAREEYVHHCAKGQLIASLFSEKLLGDFCEGMTIARHQKFGFNIALQPILFRIANLVRKEPFDDLSKIDKLMVELKVKTSTKLCDTIDGLQAGDEAATFKCLLSAIGEHVKRIKIRMSKGPVSREDIIAQCHSVLWNLAVARGMSAPELPEEYLPFMLTRKTLDMD